VSSQKGVAKLKNLLEGLPEEPFEAKGYMLLYRRAIRRDGRAGLSKEEMTVAASPHAHPCTHPRWRLPARRAPLGCSRVRRGVVAPSSGPLGVHQP
jgi:hypothetical protein